MHSKCFGTAKIVSEEFLLWSAYLPYKNWRRYHKGLLFLQQKRFGLIKKNLESETGAEHVPEYNV